MLKKKMVCPACGMEHGKAVGCSLTKIQLDAIAYQRIVYGSSEEGFGPAVGRCMGCQVRSAHPHHWGCGFEICPACHKQLLSCACRKQWMDP